MIDRWMDGWMDRLGQVIDSDRFLPLLPLGASDDRPIGPIGLPWPVRIDLWAHPCFPPAGTPGTPG